MKLVGIALLLASFSVEAGAIQVIQDVDTSKDMHSPMELLAPFPLTDSAQWGEPGTFGAVRWTDPHVYDEFYDYYCDGVRIGDFQLRGEPDGDKLSVHVKGYLDATRANHDKAVEITVQLVDGDNVVFSAKGSDKIEDGDHHDKFNFGFVMPQTLLASPLTMRVIVRTRDY